jgi:hypothetical protein
MPYRHLVDIVVILSREALSQRSGDAAIVAGFLLEEGQYISQDGLIVPHFLSTCASAASTWGSQKVMSIAR